METHRLWIASILTGIVFCTPLAHGATPASTTQPDLSAQLAAYRTLGLPLPPQDAVLVKGVLLDGSRQLPEFYYLAFRLPPKAGEPTRLLWGTEVVRQDVQPHVTWTPTTPDEVKGASVLAISSPVFGQYFPFDADNGFAAALQCESRGWHALANSIATQVHLNLARPNTRTDLQTVTHRPPNLSLDARVNYLAWAHWCNALSAPDSDRQTICVQMDALMAAEPTLHEDWRKVDLLRSLKSALLPSKASAGSVEAQIDELVEVVGPADETGVWSDPRFTKFADKGFSIVPALLDHLEDHRLTRAVHQGSMITSRFLRVCDLASSILVNLAGPRFAVDRESGAAMEKWWTSAQKQGEEAYLVAHVFPEQPSGQYRVAFRLMLTILGNRYPSSLPRLFDSMIAAGESPDANRPNFSYVRVAGYRTMPAFITQSTLPQDKKIELLLHAVQRPSSQLAAPSNDELTHFKPEDVARVRAAIGKIPG